MIFVPEAWGHAVLNLAESIGVASEFEWGASEFAIDPPADDGSRGGEGARATGSRDPAEVIAGQEGGGKPAAGGAGARAPRR